VDSVRGFPENALLQSNVTQGGVDLRWHVLPAPDGARPSVTLGPFSDWAQSHDVSSPRTTLASAGGALQLGWSHVRFDLAVGARLKSTPLIDALHGAWQDDGVHAQLSTSL
jgi:hemolysin activation/secretion protein